MTLPLVLVFFYYLHNDLFISKPKIHKKMNGIKLITKTVSVFVLCVNFCFQCFFFHSLYCLLFKSSKHGIKEFVYISVLIQVYRSPLLKENEITIS